MILTIVIFFLIGVFAFNGIPHLVKGITGQVHMTPFAQKTSPEVNVLWGIFNFIIAWALWHFAQTDGNDLLQWIAFFVGGAVISVNLANFWKDPDAKLPWHK